MSGKGSAPRPIPDRETYENNWDRIFGKKEKQSEPIHNHDGQDEQGHSSGNEPTRS